MLMFPRKIVTASHLYLQRQGLSTLTKPLHQLKMRKGISINNITILFIFLVKLEWIRISEVGAFVVTDRKATISRLSHHDTNKALFMVYDKNGNSEITDIKKNANVALKATLAGLAMFVAPFVTDDIAWAETKKEAALEEIWQLADKYYLDRNFNNQNWNDVKEKYLAKLGSSNDEEQDMKLSTEMIATLGDKYSRVLNKQAYSDIQKYDLIGVGATLMPDSNKNIMVGAPPVKGSAAYKAGIEYGDIITAVDGKKTAGRSSFDIIDQINDDPNKKVLTFSVYRPETDISFDVTLPRVFQQVRNPVSYAVSEKRDDGKFHSFSNIC